MTGTTILHLIILFLSSVVLCCVIRLILYGDKPTGEPFFDIDGKEWVIFGRPSPNSGDGPDGGGIG